MQFRKINFPALLVVVLAFNLLLAPQIFAAIRKGTADSYIDLACTLVILTLFARVLLTFGIPVWGAILSTILTFFAAVFIMYLAEHRYLYDKRMEKSKQESPPTSSVVDPKKMMNLT